MYQVKIYRLCIMLHNHYIVPTNKLRKRGCIHRGAHVVIIRVEVHQSGASRRAGVNMETSRRRRPDSLTRFTPLNVNRILILTKTKHSGNVREVWVPKGKLLAGPIAILLKQDTSIFLLGTITHITRKF